MADDAADSSWSIFDRSPDRQRGHGLGLRSDRSRKPANRWPSRPSIPQLAQAEGFRERFEAEIESLKTLSHEGIVRLYGYGEQDGVLFYSMELVDGSSLEDELKAGRRFDWREVTDIAIQLCGGAEARPRPRHHPSRHQAGQHPVRRRPAREAGRLRHRPPVRQHQQLTTAGGVLGTADYMSPEQADGRPVTARCDQYSLGGVMYALLDGPAAVSRQESAADAAAAAVRPSRSRSRAMPPTRRSNSKA